MSSFPLLFLLPYIFQSTSLVQALACKSKKFCGLISYSSTSTSHKRPLKLSSFLILFGVWVLKETLSVQVIPFTPYYMAPSLSPSGLQVGSHVVCNFQPLLTASLNKIKGLTFKTHS